tara:strand:- start:78 stop:644 length:567 start_codon:yes stop_codon:yes gene_type:complete
MSLHLNQYSVKNFIENRYEFGTSHFSEIKGILDSNIYDTFRKQKDVEFIKEVIEPEKMNKIEFVEAKKITIDEAFLDKKTKIQQKIQEKQKSESKTESKSESKPEKQESDISKLDQLFDIDFKEDKDGNIIDIDIISKDENETEDKEKIKAEDIKNELVDTFNHENKEILNSTSDTKKVTISLDALEE